MKKRLLSMFLALSMLVGMMPIVVPQAQADWNEHSYGLIYNDAIYNEKFMQEYLKIPNQERGDVTASAGVLFENLNRVDSVSTFPTSFTPRAYTLIYSSVQKAAFSNKAWSGTWQVNDTEAGELLNDSAQNSNDAQMRINATWANNGGTTYMKMGDTEATLTANSTARTMTTNFPYEADDILTIGGTAGNNGSITNISMALVDNTKPKLSYATLGNNSLSIYMDECIRLADNATSNDVTGGLTATYINTETGTTGGTITYELQLVANGYMLFTVADGQTPESQSYTITQLTGIWVDYADDDARNAEYEIDVYGMLSADSVQTGYLPVAGTYTFDDITYANKLQKLGTPLWRVPWLIWLAMP